MNPPWIKHPNGFSKWSSIDWYLVLPFFSPNLKPHFQHHSPLHLKQVMWLQPPSRRTFILQNGHDLTSGRSHYQSLLQNAPSYWHRPSCHLSPHLKHIDWPQEQSALFLQQHGAQTVFSQPGLAHHFKDLSLLTKISV